MPSNGFSSVTIHTNTYRKLKYMLDQERDGPWSSPIKTYGDMLKYYLSSEVERASKQPILEIMGVSKHYDTERATDRMTVIIRDNRDGHIAEVSVYPGSVECQLCEKDNCIHQGAAYSDHRIYEVLNQ